MEKKDLDCIFVPLGLIVMVNYHLWLLYRIITQPLKTVIGINAYNRRIWVQTMMKDPAKNGVLAVQTLRNNIMASTLMASTAITLASLLAVVMTNHIDNRNFIIGNQTDLIRLIKLFCILVCFLLAFLLSTQSVRYYSHANVLINVPAVKNRTGAINYVTGVLNRGGYFWSLGLRAYYFSFPMFLWVFGPVPMATSCFLMIFVLYFLDVHDYDSGGGEDQIWNDIEAETGEC